MNDIYTQDTFYAIHKLNFKKKIELLKECKDLSYTWWMDALGLNNQHIYREKIEILFNDALAKARKDSAFVFIHRKGYPNREWYLETGFTTLTSPNYYLWINVDKKYIEQLVNKYQLTLLQ